LSTTDTRVVEMRFENGQFEKGIDQSSKSLDKFKDKLDFKAASKGMDELEKSSQSVKLIGLTSACEGVTNSFSKMEMVTASVINNIVTDLYGLGKKITSALTIDSVLGGFNEYELKIKSIQTIFANTSQKGATLDDVNESLDRLNKYADETIYNFAQMTENMGKFTAAGLSLDQSEAGVKGLLNLAGLAGTTNEAAQRAMYQVSQALSAGTFRLQDWNSITNAGMDVEQFRDSIMETARRVGVDIDGLIDQYGSFRLTLQENWLTSEIMMESLLKLTGDYTKEQWMEIGYTEEQAEGIVALGEKAVEGTTKVRTFSQLIDTLQEELGSGWTNTWEDVLGDFDEATELFSGWHDVLSKMISDSSEARSAIIADWKKMGGRTEIIEGIENVFEGFGNILSPIKEAFSEIFDADWADTLHDISSGFKSLAAAFKDFTSKEGPKLKSAFKGIFTIIKSVIGVISSLIKIVSPLTDLFGPLIDAILSVAAALGELITKLSDAVNQSGVLQNLISLMSSGFQNVVTWLAQFIDGFDFSKLVEPLEFVIGLIGSLFGELNFDATDGITTAIEEVGDVSSSLAKAAEPVSVLGGAIEVVNTKASDLNTTLQNFYSWFNNTFGPSIEKLRTSLQGTSLYDIIGLVEMGAIWNWLFKINKSLKNLKNVFDGFGELVEAAKKVLDRFTKTLKTFQGTLRAETIKRIAESVAILAAAMIALGVAYKYIGQENMDSAVNTITKLATGMTVLFGVISNVKINTKKVLKAAGAMSALGAAMLVLSGAIANIAGAGDPDQIEAARFTIEMISLAFVAEIEVLSNSLSNLNIKEIVAFAALSLTMALAISKISKSISVIIPALKELDENDLKKVVDIAGTISLAVLALSYMVSDYGKISKGLNTVKKQFKPFGNTLGVQLALVGASLIEFAAAIGILVVALAGLSAISALKLKRSLNAMAELIIVFASMMSLLTLVAGTIDSAVDLLALSVAFISFATAIQLIVLAVAELSAIDAMNGTGSGLSGVVILIASLAGGLVILGTIAPQLTVAATAILALASSIAIMAVAVLALQNSNFYEMLTGIRNFIMVLAAGAGLAKILSGLNASLNGLSSSILKIGVGCLAFAAALAIVTVGLVLFGPAISAAISSLEELAPKIKEVIPIVADLLLTIVTVALQKLNEYLPDIIEALKQICLTLLEQVAEYIGLTAEQLYDDILYGVFLGLGLKLGYAILAGFETVPVVGWVIAAITLVVAGFVLLWNKCDDFRNYMIDWWEDIKENIQIGLDNWNEFVNGIKTGIDNLTQWFVDLKNKFVDLVSLGLINADVGITGDYNAGGSKGGDYGQGYADGISGASEKVSQSAAGLANTAATSTAKAQDSNSPSEVAKQLGIYFGEGYAGGLDESLQSITDSSRKLVEAAEGGVTDGLEGIQNDLNEKARAAATEVLKQYSEGTISAVRAKEILKGIAYAGEQTGTEFDNQTAQAIYDAAYSITNATGDVMDDIVASCDRSEEMYGIGTSMANALKSGLSAGLSGSLLSFMSSATSIGSTVSAWKSALTSDTEGASDVGSLGLSSGTISSLRKEYQTQFNSIANDRTLSDENRKLAYEALGESWTKSGLMTEKESYELKQKILGSGATTSEVNSLTTAWNEAKETAAEAVSETLGDDNPIQALLDGFSSNGSTGTSGSSGTSSGSSSSSSSKTAEELREEKYNKIVEEFADALEAAELDKTTADLEYELWESLNTPIEEAAQYAETFINDKNTKKLEKLNKQLTAQTTRKETAYKEYEKVVAAFGKESEEAQESYNKYLEEYTDLQEIQTEIDSNANDLADELEEAAEKRADLIDEAYQELLDGYERAYNKKQKISSLAQALAGDLDEDAYDTATSNRDSALSDIQSAYDDIVSYNDYVDRYNEAVKEYGSSSSQAKTYRKSVIEYQLKNGIGDANELISEYKSLFDTSKFTADQLKEFNESVEALTKANNSLTGAKIEEVAAKLFTLYDNATDTTYSFDQLGAAYDRYNKILADNNGDTSAKEVQEAYNDLLDYRTSLAEATNTLGDSIGLGTVGKRILSSLAVGFSEAWPSFKETLGDTLSNNLAPYIEKLDLPEDIKDALTSGFKKLDFSDLVSTLLEKILDAIAKSGFAEAVANGIGVALNKALGTTSTATSDGSTTGNVASGLVNIAASVGSSKVLSTVLAGSSSGTATGIAGIASTLVANLGNIGTAIMEVGSVIIDVLSGPVGWVLGIAALLGGGVLIGSKLLKKDSTTEAAEEVTNAINEASDAVSTTITDGYSLVSSSDDEDLSWYLGKMIADNALAPESYDLAQKTYSSMAEQKAVEGSVSGEGTTNTTYNFTQNNTSPKSLSQKDIYRQTKNQLSAVKNRGV